MSNEKDNKENENNVNIENQKFTIKGKRFHKKVWYSITKFEKYPEMSAEGFFSAYKYLFKIMAIFAIIISIAITIQFSQMVNKSINYIKDELPNFYYKDGVLTVESDKEIIISEAPKMIGKIIIDTKDIDENQVNEYLKSIPNEEHGIILLKDKAILKNLVTSGDMTYEYKETLEANNIKEFTKQNIIDFRDGQQVTSLYVAFAFAIFLYVFVMYLVSTTLDTILLAILGFITALIAKIKMKFVAIYNMAVYALTLSIILNLIYIIVNMFTGFKMTYFQVMYTSVAYIYLVAAIFIIKSEFIKKQAELMKIIEEQKNQEEENLENQEESKDNKETGKEEKKEDKNKNNEEDNKNNGEEPEGSNA